MKRLIEYIHLNSESLKAIIKLLVPIILVVILVNQLPSFLKDINYKRYEIEIVGRVEGVSVKESIKESLSGGRVQNKAYQIDYNYKFKSDSYLGRTTFLREELTMKERSELERMRKGDMINVRIKKDDYGKSIIILK